jgi:OOP family OmpA-OmpF porin
MPQPRLDEIAIVLQQNPSLTDITITGYTDRIGKPKYNQKLSERRANAVREYLVSKGIDGSRLKAVGQGEANPVVTCNQKKRSELIACLAPNRRVEVEQITIEKRVQ